MTRVLTRCGAVAMVVLAAFWFTPPAEGKGWTGSADGLLFREFSPVLKSGAAEDPVVVVKVDPSRYSFRLVSAREHGGKPRTLRQWCEEFGLLAAINAGMYRPDLRSTGYMKDYGSLNNPAFNPGYGAFMLFNPKEKSLPAVKWVDSRKDKRWRERLAGYHSVIQNYRMISGGRKVKWPEQDQPHSTAALGMDNSGHVLFLFSRAEHTPRDFIDILLSLPIQIRDAMYLEGGDDASLCLRREGGWVEWWGRDEIPLLPQTGAPRVPNAIGVTRGK